LRHAVDSPLSALPSPRPSSPSSPGQASPRAGSPRAGNPSPPACLARPDGLSPRAGAAASSSSAPRQLAGKQLPYYSQKPERITTLNLNDTLPLPGDPAEKIYCRHLAMTWVLQVSATGKPDYAMLGDSDALQARLPPGIDGLHERFERSAAEVHFVALADWGPFAAAQLQGLAAGGGEATKCLLVRSASHVMAMALKVKPGPDGEPRFVANFYDPNLTAAHKRTASDRLHHLEAIQAQDLFPDSDALADYFGDETDAMIFALPAGGLDKLPALPPPGGDPQRRVTGPVPPLRPSVMHHIGLGGFAGTLSDLLPAFTELARRNPAEAAEFLAGMSSEGTPALHMALQDGHAHVITEFGRFLEAVELDEDDLADLLAARDDAKTSGLFMAMQGGRAEAVRAFIDCVAASGLPAAKQVTLLCAHAPPHDLGLVLAMRPGALPALLAFLDGLAAHGGLSLEDKVQVLGTPGRHGRAALGNGLVRGEPEAVAALTEWITRQGFSSDDQCELLMAYDDEDTPALTLAMEHNAAANITAFVDAVLASDLDEDDKVHVLTAAAAPGELLHHARRRGSDDAIAAFEASIRRSSLPPDVQDMVLTEAPKRRRTR